MPREQLDLVLGHLRRVAGCAAQQELTDAQLLERYVRGRDEEAFATLVHRHGRLVRSVCRHVLHHEEDTGDAFQATFLVFACKAASIRKTSSVASYLYGVAYRTAMNAKRARTRRNEEQAEARGCSREQPFTEAALREVQAILDDEVNNLVEKYRAPFVLCCLQGKSRAEAARELGWKEGTVFSRLARARKELQQRLSRRGVVLTAALCAVELSRTGVTAAVKPALTRGTIKAALSFAADKAVAADLMSASVAALAKGVLQSMGTTKRMIGTVVLLMAGFLTSAGLLMRQALAAKPAEGQQQTAPHTAPEDKKAAPKADEVEVVAVDGTVLGSDGQPFEGAKVYLWTNAVKKPADMPVQVTTGADGRFRITVAKADLERGAKVVARASAHGPDWAELAKVGKDARVTLRLVKDDVPISGRLVDLEGQPVAGATVQLTYLEKRKEEGDLTPWIETKRQWARGNYVSGVAMIGLAASALDVPTSVTTGKDGGFRLTGFGRERVVHLSIRGKGIEDSNAEAITRAGPVAGLPVGSYAATFRHPVRPSKPVVGTVKEKGTGKLLAGIMVAGAASPAGTIGATVRAEAVTDQNGKYTLSGVGKCEQYWIAAGSAPYFNCTKLSVADTQGLEPLTVDFELVRGVAVKGRLTDQVTGKPVRGYMSYIPLADNPNLIDFSELGKPQIIASDEARARADGSFTVTTIPGPGVLCARAEDEDRFLAAEVDGIKVARPVILAGYHAVIPVNPSEKDPNSSQCDIGLVPGRTLTGTVVEPDGQPLAGAFAAGLGSTPKYYDRSEGKQAKTTFTVSGLNPKKSRVLLFVYPEKKLAKLLTVRPEEPGPLTVRLEPLGTLTGRLVDAEAKPLAGLTVSVRLSFKPENSKDSPPDLRFNSKYYQSWSKRINGEAMTDRDGKFRVEGLVPGLKYDLTASEGEIRPGVTIPYHQEGVSVESGKTKNLGDLKSKGDKEGTDKKR